MIFRNCFLAIRLVKTFACGPLPTMFAQYYFKGWVKYCMAVEQICNNFFTIVQTALYI